MISKKLGLAIAAACAALCGPADATTMQAVMSGTVSPSGYFDWNPFLGSRNDFQIGFTYTTNGYNFYSSELEYYIWYAPAHAMITIAGHSKEFDSAVVFSSGHLDSQTYFQADINTTMGEYFTDQAKSDCEAWDGCFDYFGFADVQGTFFGGQMPVSAFLDTEFETDLLSSSSAPNVEARIVLVDNLGFPGSNGTLFLIPDHFEVRAVPEPATWALMLAGFGGIGAVLRTRRRQPPEGVA